MMEFYTPLAIFDLDGTVADIEHRRHLVSGGKRNYNAFFAACPGDTVHTHVVEVAEALQAIGYELWLWSGRSDQVITQTYEWLEKQKLLSTFRHKRFRVAGDYTPDHELKKLWYDQMKPEDRDRLQFTFDDRDRLVAMWRGLGVPCFQVAPGTF